MMSPGISAKKRHGGSGGSGFALGCGCKDVKSVSVSASVSASASASASPSATGTSTTTATRRRGAGTNPSASTTTDTLTLTSASSFLWEDAVAELDYNNGDLKLENSATTPSFSGLLRELNELEQSVVSWGRKSRHDKKLLPPPQEHRKVKSGGKGGGLTTGKEDCGGGSIEAGLDGSVAVVKQSDDPLSDFRQSMLQMIVENGIVAGDDLREMLLRFLSLNAPQHHDIILRAFAEIWDDVFAASLDPFPATAPAHTTRREQAAARPPIPRTPPRNRHPPPAWRL